MSGCQIYQQEMILKKHGFPVWKGDPYGGREIQIGDIGYMDEGEFKLIVPLCPDHHRLNDDLETTLQYFPGPLFSENLEKRSITTEGGVQLPSLPVDVQCHLSLSSSRSGCAVLNLEQGDADYIRCSDVDKEDLGNLFLGEVRQLLAQAINDRKAPRQMSLNRLILVTGFYKTGNWEAAALSSSSSEGNFDFNIGAMASGNGGLSFDWSSVHHLSPNHSTGHCHRRSPASEPLLTSTSPPPTESDTTQVASIAIQNDVDPSPTSIIQKHVSFSKCCHDHRCAARNQCIFLRGFRIRERLVLKDQIEALVVPEESTPSWPERLRRLFRSGNTQTSGSSSGAKRAPSAPAPLESIEGSPGPDLCDKLYDEIANEKFMLKNDMDVVVVHDDELIQSLEKNLEGPPKDIDLGFALGGRGFTPSILSKQPEQPGVHGDSDAKGGTGGYGAGLVLEEPVVYIDDTAKTLLKPLDTTAFCQKYHLGDEICKLLTNEGYETVNALFEENENEWENLQLKTGHIAELKWAMKKMLLLEYPEIELVDKNGEYAPEIYGWTGGHGTAKAPQIALEDVFRFRRIGGGIGGAGGANGVKKPNVVAIGVNTNPTPQRIVIGTSEPPEVVVAGEATPKTRPNVIGGRGGAGGPGVALGGTGGVGGAAKVPILYVAFFKRISGGIGGAGGYAVKQGGDGGDGEANIFSNLIYSIDKETRRRMPHMPLEELEISANLRGRLKNHGFRTVGGLFEAYEQDLQPPDFKRGHIGGLKVALRKVAFSV